MTDKSKRFPPLTSQEELDREQRAGPRVIAWGFGAVLLTMAGIFVALAFGWL